jgi:hypothetical protein
MKQNSLKTDITIPEDLWSTSILPEGLLERWVFAENALVEAGDPVADVRIEGALHTILAPAKGRLHIRSMTNSVVEPGSMIGAISRVI